VKGWSAVLAALALGAAPAAAPAQPSAPDLNGAARELARKTVALAGKGEAVAVTWRDLSSLGSAALGQARGAFEAGLRDAGGRVSENVAAAEAQVTLAENQSQYLLVEEIRRGDDRQVWIAGWSRSAPAAASAGPVMLETRLVWEQQEQMLDAAVDGDRMLVLSPTRLVEYARVNGAWQGRAVHAIATGRPWPRDARGRLYGFTLRIRLPGAACASGDGSAVACAPSDEPWTLDSGRSLLLATFAASRNYFDGRVVTQEGVRKTVPPFYSAAAADDGGRPVWLLATVDGGTQMFDASLDPIGAVAAWGSDIAGTDVRCGGRTVVLATRPGDGRDPDAIRAYAIVNRAVVAMGAPAEFPGPVTALWPAGGGAMAIVRNAATGQYQAYAVTVACGR